MGKKGTPEHDLVLKARAAGKKARVEGRSRDSCPIIADDYPVRGCRAAWLEGWDSGGSPASSTPPQIQTKTPEVKIRPVDVTTRGIFLLAGAEMPKTYTLKLRAPCEHCRCLELVGGDRAVICRSTWEGYAYLECRNCGAQFKRRIEE